MPVVVVGMHRSGTSLVASILESSGLHLGERLVPANRSNVQGHFEDVDLVHFHRAALQALGHHPDGWDEVVLSEMPDVLAARARALVDARSSRPLWGWKDPRTTLFLPFWERLLPEARFVFVYRNPWEVIDSLYRRGDERFREDPAASARVWSHYNGVILDSLARVRERGILFDLEDVVADPLAFVECVNDAFGLQLHRPSEVFKPDLLRRGRTLADWRALSESLLSAETRLLKRLDGAAHRLAADAPSVARAKPVGAPEGALLRQWAALRAAERSREDIGAPEKPRPKDAFLKLYIPVRGEYSESSAVNDVLESDGRLRDYLFLIPYDGSGPLRLDAGESVGIVEVEVLTVRARESGVAVSWSGPSWDTAPLRLVNAVRIPRSRDECFCFLSLNDDPQIYLDLPDRRKFHGDCQVEIRVSFRALADEAFERAAGALLRELVAATSTSALLRAQLADAKARQSEAANTMEALGRRLTEVTRALESSEADLAEQRDRAADSSRERHAMKETLARSENRLGEASRSIEALQRSRAYRLGRLLIAPWRMARSAMESMRGGRASSRTSV